MLSREVRLGEHPFPLSSLYNSIHPCRWRTIQLLTLWQTICTFWWFEKNMKELILKNNSHAYNVARSLQSLVIWNNIKELMQVKNHTAVHIVTRSLHCLLIWNNMKEFILVKNHSAAPTLIPNNTLQSSKSPFSRNHHILHLLSMDGTRSANLTGINHSMKQMKRSLKIWMKDFGSPHLPW